MTGTGRQNGGDPRGPRKDPHEVPHRVPGRSPRSARGNATCSEQSDFAHGIQDSTPAAVQTLEQVSSTAKKVPRGVERAATVADCSHS